MGMATNHDSAVKNSDDPGSKRLTSIDGRLAFEFSRTQRGVYVERTEIMTGSSSMTHAMLVMKPGDFARYIETDNSRFEQPAFYDLVQRQVEEMLDANS